MGVQNVLFGLIVSVLFCKVYSVEIPITSLLDSGPETLREALLKAQDVDILNFQSDLSGTILLQSSLPNIFADLTIQGPAGKGVTIDGARQYQIFNVSSGIPSIFNLQLVNGAASLGWAVRLQSVASASLKNVSVSHCEGNACDSPIFLDAGSTLSTENLFISNPGKGAGKNITCSSGSSLFLISDESIEPQIVIEGSTSFLKTGKGTVHLFTSAPFDAEMLIDQGSLVFNGTTDQTIQVGINGTLKGICSCFSLLNEGKVAPGNSIGTITVAHDYAQSGILQIEISASSGSSDLLQVGGNTFLNGTLILSPEPGLYLNGDTFTILTTGGSIAGSFDKTISTEPGLVFALHYFPTSIQVEILKNSVSLEGAAFGGNTNKIASAFENAVIIPGSDLFSVAAALNTLGSTSALQSALNQMDPDLFLSLAWSDATTLYQLSGIASSQQFSFCDMSCMGMEDSCCPPRKEKRIWLSGIGEKTEQNTIASLVGFRTYTEGALVGYDQRVCDPLTVGGYGGYTHSNLVWKDRDHKGKTRTGGHYASLYGSVCLKHLELDASFLGSFYQYTIARKIDFATIHRVARSSPHGYGLLGHFGATGFFSIEKLHFSPFAKVDCISIWQSHFREHGAKSIDMEVHSTKTNFIHAEAGLFVSRRLCTSWGAVAPRAALSWVYLGPTSGTDLKGGFARFSEPRTFHTSKHGFNAVSPMVALDITAGNHWWISFAYKGEFSKDRTEQNLNLDVKWQF